MRSLVIGASAGLGRAIAETLAEDGHILFLVASDEDDLRSLSADLALRFNAEVHSEACDLANIDPRALRGRVIDCMKGIQNVFFVAGLSVSEDTGPINDELATRLMEVNFVAGVRVVNAFLGDLANDPDANIVGMGSVAACRGRRNNSIYGASKRGLEFYFDALRHYLAAKKCQVQFYRLGYLHTRMTMGQSLPFPLMDPQVAARKICSNLGRDMTPVHLPYWWFGITSTLKLLPWWIFRRLDI